MKKNIFIVSLFLFSIICGFTGSKYEPVYIKEKILPIEPYFYMLWRSAMCRIKVAENGWIKNIKFLKDSNWIHFSEHELEDFFRANNNLTFHKNGEKKWRATWPTSLPLAVEEGGFVYIKGLIDSRPR